MEARKIVIYKSWKTKKGRGRKLMKQIYHAPEADLVILNADDIITLSSILEPDFEEEENNEYQE